MTILMGFFEVVDTMSNYMFALIILVGAASFALGAYLLTTRGVDADDDG